MERRNTIFRATIVLLLAALLGGCLTDQALVRKMPSMGVNVKDTPDYAQRPTNIVVLYPKHNAITDRKLVWLHRFMHGSLLKQ